MSSAWKCPDCGLINNIARDECQACFTPSYDSKGNMRFTLQQRAELGVYGFMRESLCEIGDIDIPNDLIQLVATWYGMIDYWDVDNFHSSLQYKATENAVHRTDYYDGICSQGYGVLNVKRGEIKVWKLQLMEIDPICHENGECTALIGIIDSTQVEPNLYGDFCNKRNNGYGISCVKGRKYFKVMQGFKYCDPIRKGDIITMELDMTDLQGNCTLKYKITRNGDTRDYGFAFKKVDANVQWRLAIAMYYRECIRLIQ